MPVHTPESFIREETVAEGAAAANLALWISEPGGLTQFGSYVEVLQPGTRSSLKHWHGAEDEMVYVLAGQVTLVEGDSETLLNPGDAATFRALPDDIWVDTAGHPASGLTERQAHSLQAHAAWVPACAGTTCQIPALR